MTNRTISQAHLDVFLPQMTQQMATVVHQMSEWTLAEARTLQELEQMTLKTIKELGTTMLMGLCRLLTPSYPVEHVPCPCGQTAMYQRTRVGQVTTLLGLITVKRPYYLCAHCHHGHAPLDQELGLCAGSISAGLAEILALLGAQQDSFQDAVALLDKLTLVQVCPNAARMATEELGAVVAQTERQLIDAAFHPQHPTLPPQPAAAPRRIYVSLDGTMVHLHAEGWKEVKLGAFYTTRSVHPHHRPERLDVRAEASSFVADFADPQDFGQALWVEGCRRGVPQADEVVAIGDGAHWIWNLVDEHFPTAIQIVDWYHAAKYIWSVAQAVYGAGSDLATYWAHNRLDDLWDGQAAAVLKQFQQHADRGKAVQDAITYYTNNLHRMRYAEYRAQGIQIGSGLIESGCKPVIGARLKQAGMIWTLEGARAVAKVRARLRSGRWDETITQRPPPYRRYRRKNEADAGVTGMPSSTSYRQAA